MAFDYIITGNFGNGTIAVMQWLQQQRIQKNRLAQAKILLAYFHTGWQANEWLIRIEQAVKFAVRLNMQPVCIFPPDDFVHSVQEKGSFPNQHFQWCARDLKGLPLLTFLDQIDVKGQATIVMGKSLVHLGKIARGMWNNSDNNEYNNEHIEQSEHFGDRRVWLPLHNMAEKQIQELVNASGLDYLTHRSLECDPCIHNHVADFKRLSAVDYHRVKALELAVGETMFERAIDKHVEFYRDKSRALQPEDRYDMGCGSPWGCGI